LLQSIERFKNSQAIYWAKDGFNETFAEASYQGRSVDSITVYDGDEVVPGD